MADTVRTCIGIDVGGTFTDCVLTDGTSTWRAKAPTTTGEIGLGVLAAAELAARRSGTTLDELLPKVSRFGLGTTAVTNTLASRTGRLVGLLATSGFEEMIPIAQGTRIVDEDGWLSTPNILEHRTIAAIEERIDRNGEVVVPIDLAQVKAAVRRLVEEEGVEAIAVSFVWSFANRPTRTRRWPRSPRSIPTYPWSRAPCCTRRSASTSAPRSPFSTRTSPVRSPGSRSSTRSSGSGDCKARCSSCTRAEARSPSAKRAGGRSGWPCPARPPASPPRSP